jgi:IS30 family transposase
VLPKKTRFDDLTQGELDEFVAEINYRLRRVLGWFTPSEILQELCSEGSTG